MRIGEIVATNIYDFQNDNFQKLNLILEKSHIKDQFPILSEFNILLKEYVIKNRHILKNGYLFPYYCSKKYSDHMTTNCAVALFCKLRKIIAKDHPNFLDRVPIKNNRYRYRIGLHSCRRWFETTIWNKYKDKMLLRDIMRYGSSKVVDVYINPYETWRNEQQILDNTFSSIYQDFNMVVKGQTKLSAYFKT